MLSKNHSPPPPTSTATGKISVSTPIAALLNQSIGVECFVKLATTGKFDVSGRGHKFSSSKGMIASLREQGHDLPDLPEMEGDITWRRHTQQWQVDVSTVIFSEGWHWREMLPRGTGDAKLLIHGIQLPAMIINHAEGMALIKIVEHPIFADPGIKIRIATNYGATTFMNNFRPASVEFALDVPRIEIQR